MSNIKISFLFLFLFFLFIKFDKHVDTNDPFNRIILRLRNHDPFNKYAGLGLTYIFEYS